MDPITDELLTHQLDLLRLNASVGQDVAKLLAKMQVELTTRLREEDLTALGKARMEAMLKEIKATIAEYYKRVSGEMGTTLGGVAQAQASHIGTIFTRITGAEQLLPTETFLGRLVSNVLIQGAPSAQWWAWQGADIAFKFATQVRQGAAIGETNEQIVRRIVGSKKLGIPGVMDIARRNARALVHTSIQTVANEARVATFEKNDDIIECLVWLSTLDSKTCLVCAARDLHTYALGTREPLDGGPPWDKGPGAMHFNDRCIATIRMKDLPGAPPLPKGERASVDGPVKGGTSFEAFLDRKGKAFVEEYLGPGRYQLWKDNKLTLEQLLNPQGRMMSLAELRAKYG